MLDITRDEISTHTLCNAVIDAATTDREAFDRRDLQTLDGQLSEQASKYLRAHFMLVDLAREFERHVWFEYLQEKHNKAKKGIQAIGLTRSILVLEFAGRTLVTLKDVDEGRYGGAWITFITEAHRTDSCMGYHGMAGTMAELQRLVLDCISLGPKNFEEANDIVVVAG